MLSCAIYKPKIAESVASGIIEYKPTIADSVGWCCLKARNSLVGCLRNGHVYADNRWVIAFKINVNQLAIA